MSSLAFTFAAATLAAPAPVQVELRADHREPFIGQLVTIEVDLKVPAHLAQKWSAADPKDPSGLPRLHVPWLQPQFNQVEWQRSPKTTAKPQGAFGVHITGRNTPGWAKPIDEENGAQPPVRRYRLLWQGVIAPRVTGTGASIVLEPVEFEFGAERVQSGNLELAVRRPPLPRPDLPPLLLGVGEFAIEPALAPTTVKLGDECLLTLTIRGTGPLKLVEAPDLSKVSQLARGFRVSAAAEPANPPTGQRQFQYRLRPLRAGTRNVPRIAYAFFDPKKEDYQVRETTPLEVLVADASGDRGTPAYPPGEVPEQLRLVPPGRELLEPVTVWPGTVALAACLLLPPLAAIAAWAFMARRMRHRFLDARWRSLAGSQAFERLDALRVGDTAAVELGVSRVLTEYLRTRFALRPIEPTEAEVEASLLEAEVPTQTVTGVRELLWRCAAGRFGPDTTTDTPILIEMGRRVIDELEASA